MEKQKIKNSILCISFWTPPIVRPQSILIGKMIPEWMRQGVDPVILTYDICGKWDIPLPIFTVPDNKTKNRLMKLPVLRWVDEYFYYRKLFKISKNIIKQYDIQSVFSFSNPQSSNVLGAIIKKKLGIPFIAYFSDPWYDNSYKPLGKISSFKTYLMERFVIKWADKIIFTNEAARSLVMKKYPASWQEKSTVIPHCFDPNEYAGFSKKTDGKFVISHIGAFYKERNPEPLFKALAEVKKTRPDIFQKIELQLVGAENPYAGYSKETLRSLINGYNLEKSINILPAVEYKKSLEHMVNSDCLIVIDANFKNSPFLPSKLIDYAGSKTQIISITPPESPTEEVVRGLGFESFSYDKIRELTEHIIKIITSPTTSNPNPEYLKQFEVKETTKKLLNEIQNA